MMNDESYGYATDHMPEQEFRNLYRDAASEEDKRKVACMAKLEIIAENMTLFRDDEKWVCCVLQEALTICEAEALQAINANQTSEAAKTDELEELRNEHTSDSSRNADIVRRLRLRSIAEDDVAQNDEGQRPITEGQDCEEEPRNEETSDMAIHPDIVRSCSASTEDDFQNDQAHQQQSEGSECSCVEEKTIQSSFTNAEDVSDHGWTIVQDELDRLNARVLQLEATLEAERENANPGFVWGIARFAAETVASYIIPICLRACGRRILQAARSLRK